jgi:hypothetical protein
VALSLSTFAKSWGILGDPQPIPFTDDFRKGGLRREVGIDMARIILGHRHLDVTAIYAEADFAKAEQVMAQLG